MAAPVLESQPRLAGRAEVLDSLHEQLSLRYFLHQVRNLRASRDVVADR